MLCSVQGLAQLQPVGTCALQSSCCWLGAREGTRPAPSLALQRVLPGPLPHAALLPRGVGPQPAHAPLWSALLPAAPQARRQVHACDALECDALLSAKVPVPQSAHLSGLSQACLLLPVGALSRVFHPADIWGVWLQVPAIPVGPAHAGAGQLEGLEAGLEAADCSVLASRCSGEAMQPPATRSAASCLPRLEDDSIPVLASHLFRKRCVHHDSDSLLCRAASITPASWTLQVACWNSSSGILQTALGRLRGARCTTLLPVLLPDATPNTAATASARPGCLSAQSGLLPTGGHSQQLPGIPESTVARCCRTGTGLARMMACTRALGRHSGEFHRHSTKSQSTLTRLVPCRSSGSRGKPRRH